MRVFQVVGALLLGASSCGPQCEQVARSPSSICRQLNDGAIAAGQPFSLTVGPAVVGGTCQVTVTGQQLELRLSGLVCSAGSAAAKPAIPTTVQCAVPALDAGTYSVKDSSISFAVPETAGSALPTCP